MLKLGTSLIALAGLALGTAATADPVTCQNLNVPVQGAPDDAVITLTFDPGDILKQCTSATGLPLDIVTPENGSQASPAAGETVTIPFTVEDSQGNYAEAQIVVTRTVETPATPPPT